MAVITIANPSLQEFTEALIGRPLRPTERDILAVIDQTPNRLVEMQRSISMASGRPHPYFIIIDDPHNETNVSTPRDEVVRWFFDSPPTRIRSRVLVGLDLGLGDIEVSQPVDLSSWGEPRESHVEVPADPPPSHKRNNLDRAAQGREARAQMVARAMARRK